jgi:hypothetical protein
VTGQRFEVDNDVRKFRQRLTTRTNDQRPTWPATVSASRRSARASSDGRR